MKNLIEFELSNMLIYYTDSSKKLFISLLQCV